MKKPLTLRQLRIMLNGAKWSDFENGYLNRGGVQFSLHRGAFLGRLCYAAAAQDMFVVIQPTFTTYSRSLAKPLSINHIHIGATGLGINTKIFIEVFPDGTLGEEETADA